MNPFQKQMKKDMEFHKSIRKEADKQKEVELMTGIKFPCTLKPQAGYPLGEK